MYRLMIVAALAVPLSVQAADVSVSGKVSVKDGNNSLSIGFSNEDRKVADRYYRDSGQRYHEEERDRDDRREGRGEREDDRHGKGKHGHGKGTPPGLAKKGGVPPGLAKKGGLPPGLQRNQRLPDDVAYESLPRELEGQLPPLPSQDYVRVQVGSDLAILNKKTRVVVDFMRAL